MKPQGVQYSPAPPILSAPASILSAHAFASNRPGLGGMEAFQPAALYGSAL